jgi:hypothetical protein
VSRDQQINCHYCPTWVSALWLIVGIAALLYSSACHPVAPVVDLGSKPPAAKGTLTGIVRGPEGTSAVSGRTVEIVNVASGEKHTAQTAGNGGFTIELPKGKYRLALPLHDGETLVKQPGIVDLDKGDIDSHIEFVLGPSRAAARHRSPAYRLDNGLGSPIV